MEEWADPAFRPYGLRKGYTTTVEHISVAEVLLLAERAFRQEQSATSALNERLRTQMLASLFEVDAQSGPTSVWTVEEVQSQRQEMATVLDHLGLDEVKELSEQYFERLEEMAAELEGQEIPSDFSGGPRFATWWQWMAEARSMAFRIAQARPLIAKYQQDRNRITRRSTAFLHSVNSFMSDKELVFSREAELKVKLPNGKLVNSHHLSSGELQLLILFAVLYFPSNQPDQEFVVFVDEPELSLHAVWQHRYIDSIQDANPDAQFIIATHSPEIAGPAQDAIIDLSMNGASPVAL